MRQYTEMSGSAVQRIKSILVFVETYCGVALSGQRLSRYSGLCVQAVGSGLCGQRFRARDESALEVA